MDIESTSLTVGDRSPLVSFSFLLMLPKKLLPMTKEKGKKTIEKGKEKKEKKKVAQKRLFVQDARRSLKRIYLFGAQFEAFRQGTSVSVTAYPGET